MFAWAGKLFGTEKAINSIVDKDNGLLSQVGGWVGGFNYTDEEKAEADAETREWGLSQLDALAPFKVVQRILAFAAAALWIFVALNFVASVWIYAITKEVVIVDGVEFITAIDVRADFLKFAFSDYIFWPVTSTFALYFTGGVINTVVSRKSKK